MAKGYKRYEEEVFNQRVKVIKRESSQYISSFGYYQ